MSSKNIYSKPIDIDAEWERAKGLGIDCLPDDPIIEDRFLKQHLIVWPEISLQTIGISYREAAKLLSLMGYDDPFFQTSPGVHNGEMANHEGFRDQLLHARIGYEWVRNQIDGNFASKQILEDLASLEEKTNDLLDSLSNFHRPHRVIKVRRLKDNSKFSDQLKASSDDIREIADSADWSRSLTTSQSLLDLLDLIDETKPLFKSSGGKPYIFSRTWLILEAIRIYESWNMDQRKAGVSWKSESRETSYMKKPETIGPFVRFMEELFSIFEGQEESLENQIVRNTGLATEASKIIKHIKKFGYDDFIHYQLESGLPADKFMEVLSILRSHR